MSHSQWEIIKDQCPKLYRHGIVFECGQGWFDILRHLSVKIETIISEIDENADFEIYAIQVKEKYGTLRFYMSCETDEISELIREGEDLSLQTCESCGALGKMRGTHWYEVKCDKCYEESYD